MSNNNKLLVHLHLYYHNQLDYFISKLKNITCAYDLYVTYTTENKKTNDKLRKFKNDVHLLLLKNKGYDLYPFIEVINRVNLDDYTYILKLHTKNYRKAYWSYNKISYIHYEWRDALVNALIGSKRIFQSNLKKLSENNIGMIGNKDLIYHKGHIKNEPYRLEICQKLGYNPEYDEFIAGTMFLSKSFLMKDIQSLHLKAKDFTFSTATGAVGTLAHAIESILGHTAQNHGLKIYGRRIFSFCKLRSYITRIILKKEAAKNGKTKIQK